MRAESPAIQVVETLTPDSPLEDLAEVAALVASDHLAGRSPVDGGWWAELRHLRHLLALDPQTGRILGAAACAVRPGGEGAILWLHARERRAVIDALLDRAEAVLARAPAIDAFAHATALGVGLEGLPARRRPVTHAALLGRSYVGEDRWVPRRPTRALGAGQRRGPLAR